MIMSSILNMYIYIILYIFIYTYTHNYKYIYASLHTHIYIYVIFLNLPHLFNGEIPIDRGTRRLKSEAKDSKQRLGTPENFGFSWILW